jgi:hypothetical protein
MNAKEKKRVPGKVIVAALGITCVLLAACLGVAITAYILAIKDKNDEIASLNSEISQLNSSYNSMSQFLSSYLSKLQNQSTPALNLTGATFVSIAQINLDPAEWENKQVIVAGKLSGPYPYFTAISYYYVLSSNETVTSSTELNANSIGVDFGNRGALWNGSNALVVGIVKKGTIGTIVQGAKPTTVCYIEEQALVLLGEPIQPVSGYYLPYEGNYSRIFLVSANASYGIAQNGEPCVVISATIRNDYSTQYLPPSLYEPNPTFFVYVYLTAQVFSGENQINATDVTSPIGFPNGGAVAGLNSGENATLSIYLATNNTDITSFQIVARYITGTPLP